MEKLAHGAKKIGLNISPNQLAQFHTYYQELVEWNKRINLTAITGYEEVQMKHFLDSLTITLAWQAPLSKASLRLIDVGTGAGLPGIPLKILLPDISLVLLESTAKKAGFLQHVVQKLKLDKVEVVTTRAEEAAHNAQYREKFDMVLARGIAPLPTLVELTLPFCTIGGNFIAQKKGAIEDEINHSNKATSLMGGKLREVKRIDMEEFPDKRYLVIIEKLSATPPQYPRRSGIPAKRPLV